MNPVKTPEDLKKKELEFTLECRRRAAKKLGFPLQHLSIRDDKKGYEV